MCMQCAAGAMTAGAAAAGLRSVFAAHLARYAGPRARRVAFWGLTGAALVAAATVGA